VDVWALRVQTLLLAILDFIQEMAWVLVYMHYMNIYIYIYRYGTANSESEAHR
jgi:hypothetical protein